MRTFIVLLILLSTLLTSFAIFFPPVRYTLTVEGLPNDSYVLSYGSYGIPFLSDPQPRTSGDHISSVPHTISFWSNEPHVVAVLATGLPASLKIERWGTECARVITQGNQSFSNFARCESGWNWLFQQLETAGPAQSVAP